MDGPFWNVRRSRLSARELTALHHGSVLLLEAFAQSGGTLEVLVDAAKDAALLTGDE